MPNSHHPANRPTPTRTPEEKLASSTYPFTLPVAAITITATATAWMIGRYLMPAMFNALPILSAALVHSHNPDTPRRGRWAGAAVLGLLYLATDQWTQHLFPNQNVATRLVYIADFIKTTHGIPVALALQTDSRSAKPLSTTVKCVIGAMIVSNLLYCRKIIDGHAAYQFQSESAKELTQKIRDVAVGFAVFNMLLLAAAIMERRIVYQAQQQYVLETSGPSPTPQPTAIAQTSQQIQRQ
jgi:hypothetical protein